MPTTRFAAQGDPNRLPVDAASARGQTTRQGRGSPSFDIGCAPTPLPPGRSCRYQAHAKGADPTDPATLAGMTPGQDPSGPALLRFPAGFVWGAATAAHQIEGGNTNNDWWAWEHDPKSGCVEPSGDACDSFHRWPEDVDVVAELGLGAYRFSLEWSRIEPAEGEWSAGSPRPLSPDVRAMPGTRYRAGGDVPSLRHSAMARRTRRVGGI